MFSKTKPNDPTQPTSSEGVSAKPASPAPATAAPASAPAKPKAPPSILSSDLKVTGNLVTEGDIQIEGEVDGDIRANLLTVGEGATVRGEVVADDVVLNGRVIGKVRGLKVRLTTTARVEGDIIHKTIAIESGAHFEGSVQRNDDPLSTSAAKPAAKPSNAS